MFKLIFYIKLYITSNYTPPLPSVHISNILLVCGLHARLRSDVLGQFGFHHLVHHVLQEHLYALVAKQNFAEGLLVERNLNWVIVRLYG